MKHSVDALNKYINDAQRNLEYQEQQLKRDSATYEQSLTDTKNYIAIYKEKLKDYKNALKVLEKKK
jgi:hypothetical protein